MKTYILSSLASVLLLGCGLTTFSVAEEDSGLPDAVAPAPDVNLKVKPEAETPDASDANHSTDAPVDAGHHTDAHEASSSSDAGSGSGSSSESGSSSGSGSGSSSGSGSGSSTGSGSGSSSGSGSGSSSGTGSGSGSVHDAGVDSPTTCVGTAPKCSGNILLVCGDGGIVADPCTGATPICLELAGVGSCVACEPGTETAPNTKCANNTAGYYAAISTCSPSGAWVTQTCSPSTPVCTGPTGTATCAGSVCVPGSTECALETPGHCPAGQSCDCFNTGNTRPGISICDNTGNWGPAYDCVYGLCGGTGTGATWCGGNPDYPVCPCETLNAQGQCTN